MVGEVVLLDLWLSLEELLLLHREEVSLAYVFGFNQFRHEAVDLGGEVDEAEVDESVHDVFDLVFVGLGDVYFVLEHLDEVVFLKRGAFLDLALLLHLLAHLLVALTARFLAGLGE